MLPGASLVGVVLTGLLACASDLRTRRLPNALTFGSAAVALAFSLVTGGPRALAWSLAGWVVGCCVFLPVFLLRGMGAGDVKLLAAVGAWVGPLTVLWAAVFGAIAGGVLAVVVSLAHGYLGDALRNLGRVVGYWRTFGPAPVPEFTLADAKGPRLPYSLPIVVGTFAALWLRGW
jgi:prepilin peptidase CpaA